MSSAGVRSSASNLASKRDSISQRTQSQAEDWGMAYSTRARRQARPIQRAGTRSRRIPDFKYRNNGFGEEPVLKSPSIKCDGGGGVSSAIPPEHGGISLFWQGCRTNEKGPSPDSAP